MENFPISGKAIPEINLRKITVSEWRDLFNNTQPENDGDKTLAKVSGMSLADIQNLSLYDYRALFKAVMDKAGKPLDDADPLT